MSRIESLPLEKWDADLRAMTGADHAAPIALSMMRVMAHAPELAKAVVRYTQALKETRTLPERLIELVRLRIAFHNQCRPCMSVRYGDAVADGLDEDAVCSLQNPEQAENLTAAEKTALRYASLYATDHLAIDNGVYADLRRHFTEAEIVELGIMAGFFVAFGRLGASWMMSEDLPDPFRDNSASSIGPWQGPPVLI